MKFERAIFRCRFFATLLPALLVWPLTAQDAPLPAKSKPTRVALVAVGDPPDPDFEIKNDRRYLKETATSEYPPTLLYVPKLKTQGKPDPIVMGLNLPGRQLEIHGTNTLQLMEAVQTGDQISYKEWTTIKLPVVNEDLTAFLYRSKPGASWRDSPKVLVLNNSLVAFPPRHIRVVNLSNKVVAYQLDGAEPFAVQPSEFKILPTTKPDYCSYSVAFSQGEEWVTIASHQAATLQGDARVNLVAYDTDSNSPRNTVPVRLQSFYELPPPPKPPVDGTPQPATAAAP